MCVKTSASCTRRFLRVFLEMASAPQFKRLRRNVLPSLSASLNVATDDACMDMSTADMEEALAQFTPGFCDCMAVYLVDDIEDKMAEVFWEDTTDAAEDLARIVEQVPGRYWKIGDFVNNLPCWKKEQLSLAKDGGMVQLYMFYDTEVMKGWVITDSPKVANDQTTWAWGARKDLEMTPMTLHVPFWSKKKSTMVSASCDDG